MSQITDALEDVNSFAYYSLSAAILALPPQAPQAKRILESGGPAGQVERVLEKLRLFGPTLGGGVSTPEKSLSDVEQEVWDALEGRMLLAKQIAHHLGLPLDDSAIRWRVGSIRKKGWQVMTLRGRGYYRPDAPPQNL